MTTYLILLFTVLPVLELALIIKVGSLIGATTTIIILMLTGTAGAAMARYQGLYTLREIQLSLQRGIMPTDQMIDGLLILVGGLLLLTPGFITDVFGIALLIPSGRKMVRTWIKYYFVKSQTPLGTSSPEEQSRRPNAEDADFRELS